MTIVEDIINGKLDAVIVYENETVIAFLDHDPINKGHILICPKAPYRTFIDVPDHIMIDIHRVAKLVYKKLSDKYSPDGITFIQCNGEFNDLDHFHLHIFPRYNDDGFAWLCSEIGIQTQAQLQEEAKGL